MGSVILWYNLMCNLLIYRIATTSKFKGAIQLSLRKGVSLRPFAYEVRQAFPLPYQLFSYIYFLYL